MKKRILASLLVLALCLTLFPAALAAENADFRGGHLSGVASDNGALLVTDTWNKVVWRVEGGRVSLFAGVIGAADASGEPAPVYRDGLANQAFFMEPWDVEPFLDGYAVSDAAGHAIRFITEGRVITIAGNHEKAGKTDGDAKNALFDRPTGLATDSAGALYVADAGSGTIRRIGRDGAVSTVATGLVGPTDLCWSNGVLYVAETGRCRICRVTGGRAEAFAGVSTAAEEEGEYYGGYADAPLASAKFDHPQGIAAGADGTLYVSDTGNSSVRMIRDGRVYTLLRGATLATAPASPRGLAVVGNTLRVADQIAGTVLDVSLVPVHYVDLEPGAWYLDAVETATRSGIVGGVGDGRFEPNTALSRAMFVTMLSRLHQLADGAAIIDGDASFADVPAGEWFASPVRWAADRAIVLGEDGRFVPERGISREELAVMLWRYAGTRELDVSASADALAAFSDAASVSPWAEEAMRWACTKGVLRGDGAGQLLPREGATRAQAVTMLLNFLNAYGM